MALPKKRKAPAAEVQVAPAPEPIIEGNTGVVLRAIGTDRREPYTGQYFPAGADVAVEVITSWLQCQIDAGIMEVI